jgi:hypothetical protein
MWPTDHQVRLISSRGGERDNDAANVEQHVLVFLRDARWFVRRLGASEVTQIAESVAISLTDKCLLAIYNQERSKIGYSA